MPKQVFEHQSSRGKIVLLIQKAMKMLTLGLGMAAPLARCKRTASGHMLR